MISSIPPPTVSHGALQVKITVLVENHVEKSRLIAEHGLSLLLEITEASHHKTRILFDTGQTGCTLRQNLETLKIPLLPLDAIILSHGHYDHTGGLRVLGQLLTEQKQTKPIPVFLHPGALTPKYAGSEKRSIGFLFDPNDLAAFPLNFCPSTQPIHVTDSTWFSGEIPRSHPFQPVAHFFLRDATGSYQPDTVLDDAALIVQLNQSQLVLTGCGHAGLVNILHAADRILPNLPLTAIIGGFHLHNLPPPFLRDLLHNINPASLQVIAPLHCNDRLSREIIGQTFPDATLNLSTGDSIRIPKPSTAHVPPDTST